MSKQYFSPSNHDIDYVKSKLAFSPLNVFSPHQASNVKKKFRKPLNINDLFKLKEVLLKGPEDIQNEELSEDEHLLFQ